MSEIREHDREPEGRSARTFGRSVIALYRLACVTAIAENVQPSVPGVRHLKQKLDFGRHDAMHPAERACSPGSLYWLDACDGEAR